MKDYWTQEVEEKLAEYVITDDMDEKNKIFNNHLFIPLRKLIDATIERYCIPIVDDDIKLDILTYVVERMVRFKPNTKYPSGKKATGMAYCGVLIRSWFADWKLKYTRQKKNVRFEECHEIHLNKIQ